LTLSDRIAVFNQGKLLQVGPPEELYERPGSRFVADFIGINNLIDGTVQTADAVQNKLIVSTAFGELAAMWDDRLHSGDRCVLCIRPENTTLNGTGDGHNHINGHIAFAAYLGNALRYDVDLGQGQVFRTDIRDPWHHKQLPIGNAVSVSFPVTSTVAIAGDK
jgi:ABC-type Fe3+/spermidine/putrescine transport system ATPase subunit